LSFEDRFDSHPRTARDEPDQGPPKAQAIRDPGPVAAQRMIIPNRRDQRFDRCPDGIYHFGFERARDDGAFHCVVVVWVALGIKPEPTRRPVDGTCSRGP
jgi:hypothetical protein